MERSAADLLGAADIGTPGSSLSGTGRAASAGDLVPVCRPLLPTRARLAPFLDLIDARRQYSNHGGLVLTLQDRLRALTGNAAHVAVASSGTAALAGAILAVAGRADPRRPLCLTPAFTFIGTISAIEQGGYVPHFIDVDPQTWLADPERCRAHPLLDRVGLVVPVAPYGRPVPQAGWAAFRDATGIPVVIDAAAALESLVCAPETMLGSVPVAVSFHATKAFCTGEGGGVFCGDVRTWRAALESLNFGYNLDRLSGRPGINGKMSEYHAAIGLAELQGWDDKLARFARVADGYRAAAADIGRPLHLAPTVGANYALVETAGLAQTQALMHAFAEAGIGSRRWYGPGAHRQPDCRRLGRDPLPHAESLSERLVGLPMAVDLRTDEVDRVVRVLHETAVGVPH